MMYKVIAGFAVFFVINVILSGFMESGSGMAATRLTAAATSNQTTLNVANTDGFLRSSYVMMGNEKVRYSSTTDTTLVVYTRGYDGTTAVAHARNTMVYSPQAGAVNSALGFNVASTGESVGTINVITLVWNFFFTSLPKLVTWNFAHFVGEWGQYLRLMFMAISVGLTVYLAMQIAMAIGFRWPG